MRSPRIAALAAALLAALTVSCAADGGGGVEPQPSSASEAGY